MTAGGKPRWMGASCNVSEIEPGRVLKVLRPACPSGQWRDFFDESRANGFIVERRVYEILGKNDLITPYYGCRDFQDRQGLVLAQADGTLQDMLEENLMKTVEAERRRWWLQIADAIAYIHGHGVVHCDLRPENILVHGGDLWLSDFNGSVCEERGLYGGSLPNGGFWNCKDETKPATDIFAMGSVFYAIMTGWWPFCAPVTKDRLTRTDASYDIQVTKMISAGELPEVSSVWGGDIIMGCWTGRYTDAGSVKQGVASAMAQEE